MQRSAPGAYWQGDGAPFEFGPDARRLRPAAALRPGHDVNVLIGLVNDGDLGAAAATSGVTNRTFGPGKRHPAIAVARRNTDGGYELEARVPWRALGLTIPPARGTVFSMNVNVSDATSPSRKWALRTMISSNPARDRPAQNHPALWQTVVLADHS